MQVDDIEITIIICLNHLIEAYPPCCKQQFVFCRIPVKINIKAKHVGAFCQYKFQGV